MADDFARVMTAQNVHIVGDSVVVSDIWAPFGRDFLGVLSDSVVDPLGEFGHTRIHARFSLTSTALSPRYNAAENWVFVS